MNGSRHGLLDVADAGAFLARLTRLDPAALVRLRATQPGGHTQLWARLPWRVLVTRTVRGAGPAEATVAAAELLAVLAGSGDGLPAHRDTEWRWPLPARAGQVVETVAGGELVRVARAAAGTLRTAITTRRSGERVLRDALLDHVPIVVTDEAVRVEVPQRLVQAIVQMGFLGPTGAGGDESVQVRIAGKWTGLAAPYGTAWLPIVNDFAVRPLSLHTNG
jgi:hypothetical protein